MRYMGILVAVAVGVGIAAVTAAQGPVNRKDRGAEPGRAAKRWPKGNPNAATRELLEQAMTARISKELALSDEQTVLVVRSFAEIREETRQLRMKKTELTRELRGLLNNSQDEALIQAKLEGIMLIDADVVNMRLRAFEESSRDLTVWQRAKLYLFISEFEADLRKMLARAKEHRLLREEGGPGGRGSRSKMGPPPRGQRPERREDPSAPVP